MSALLLLTPKITRLLKVRPYNIAPVGRSRVRSVQLGSLSHPMGKGARVSQRGPVEARAARAGTPSLWGRRLVCQAQLARTPAAGPCTRLEAKACAANAVWESRSWGV